MIDWLKDLFIRGDVFGIIFVIVVLVITGGVGKSLVDNWAARGRGIKGDALVKEQNGIDGLNKLTIAQGTIIERLDEQVTILTKRVDEISEKLEHEVEYSNANVALLIENGITPVPRKH